MRAPSEPVRFRSGWHRCGSCARTLGLPGRRLPIRALPPGRFGRRSRSVLRMRRTRMARRLLPVRHGYALALGRGHVLRVAAAVRAARQAIE
ncbi:hypothetical protein C2U35_06370 [Ralstonia solanacearum]|nr:hypothetical protein C2U35_06370 [Ralstonia solanacearum]